MQPIYKAAKRSFTLAMIFTLLFPLGGVLLGVGLGIGQPAMWAVGIACLGSAFYGCPIAWVGYGNKKAYVRLVTAIEEEHLYIVRDLAAQLGLSEEVLLLMEHMLLSHRELPEYGSPKPPLFTYAQMLHILDMLDARLFAMREALLSTPKGAFSDRVRALDGRKLYHPDLPEEK